MVKSMSGRAVARRIGKSIGIVIPAKVVKKLGIGPDEFVGFTIRRED